MTGRDYSANPGTATEFPARFAGISVTVPGLPHGIRCALVPKRFSTPTRGHRSVAFQAAMPPVLGAFFLAVNMPPTPLTPVYVKLGYTYP
jgi:hypothetical protein